MNNSIKLEDINNTVWKMLKYERPEEKAREYICLIDDGPISHYMLLKYSEVIGDDNIPCYKFNNIRTIFNDETITYWAELPKKPDRDFYDKLEMFYINNKINELKK